ncbi:nitrilase-related carbon-nitrogen hydrolase [Catenulispora rubra]|uniref:nitrilase-related carbon-nitrogen hydrolase n=1 Tax=Catenulispora rubra TaxID=280293 RepID=UPI0018921111|nr:nitrilase-related carbon-nitrogen hydrolase [Catenulispora rubra]
MKSNHRSAAAAIGAAAGSAILFFLGTGLRPVPWLTWLAPLPVLLMAPRVGRRAAFGLAAAAWLGGESAMWGYFIGTVQIPVPVAVLIIVGSALLFGLVVLLARALIGQRRQLLATVVFPAAWVTVELAMSQAAPFGAWWSLAYTQANVLPVFQILSVTGIWGVTFLVLLVPAAAAAVFAPQSRGQAREQSRRQWQTRGRRWQPAVAATAVLAVALGYGTLRLHSSHAQTGERVALVASDREIDPTPVESAAGHDLLDAYVSGVQALSAQGIRVVVLPEKAFTADDTSLPTLTGPLSHLAHQRHFDIVVGLILKRDNQLFNAAIDLPADGSAPVTYFKQHLVTGVEDDLTAGHGQAFVPGSQDRWALAVCFDLDFPSLVRDYRSHGATTLFVPAWDFSDDAWLHSRMAVARGVENGMTVVRDARQGALTVSDPYGRMTAEARTSGTSMVSVTAWLPSPASSTLYTRFGDWFAWTCVVLFLAGIAVAYFGNRRAVGCPG